MEVCGQLQAPAALPPGKEPPYLLDRRLGEPQSHSGSGSEEKNSQPPRGIEPQNPDRPVWSPALHQLSYHGSRIHLLLITIYCCKDNHITDITFLLILCSLQCTWKYFKYKLHILIRTILCTTSKRWVLYDVTDNKVRFEFHLSSTHMAQNEFCYTTLHTDHLYRILSKFFGSLKPETCGGEGI
jgi:hypothetical protein